MPRTDSRTASTDHLYELPQFELDYLLDDLDDPTEVMIAPRQGDDDKTQWITSDLANAVPLEAVR